MITDGIGGVNSRVVVLDLELNATPLFVIGNNGTIAGNFSSPEGSAWVELTSTFLIGDTGNNRTVMFSPSGAELGEWTCIRPGWLIKLRLRCCYVV